MRRIIIAGNWKMNKTVAEAVALVTELGPLVADRTDVDTLVCPPYTALYSAGQALKTSSVGLAAQDVFWKDKGAYTGRVAPGMLTELGVSHVIVGHSETRGRFGVAEPDFDADIMRHFGDTDASVNRKLLAVLKAGMTPICCIGETIGERKAGETDIVVAEQTTKALQGVTPQQAAALVFAYEPVWAIGTGEVCDAAEADRVCGVVREAVRLASGADAAASVRIQYGGSMKPDNAADLLARPNIDGGLIGGASLKAADFAAIIAAAPRAK